MPYPVSPSAQGLAQHMAGNRRSALASVILEDYGIGVHILYFTWIFFWMIGIMSISCVFDASLGAKFSAISQL